MGAAGRLSHGGAELLKKAFGIRQEIRPRPHVCTGKAQEAGLTHAALFSVYTKWAEGTVPRCAWASGPTMCYRWSRYSARRSCTISCAIAWKVVITCPD